MLEHSPVVSTKSPAAHLAQELKSIAVDWSVGLHRNSVFMSLVLSLPLNEMNV